MFPQELYKGYKAFESAEVSLNGYRKQRVEKDRKKTIRYYDEISYSGFDKVLNPTKVEIGPQVLFELQIMYELVSE